MANLIKSPYPDIPIPKIHIYDLLFSSAKSAYSSPFCPETDAESVGRDVAWWETREVLIDSVNGVTYKFNELKQRIEELARALRNEGGDLGVPWKLAKDQVVGLFSTNHVDFPVTVWATIRASLIMTAANPAYLVDELIHQLTDSATKVLVTSLVNLPMALEVASKIGMPARNIVLLDSRTEEERKAPGIDRTEFRHNGVKHLTIQGLVEIGRTMAPLPKLSYGPEIVDQTAYLMYSSGTTGRSKGVEQTHGNIVANVLQLQTSEKYFLPVGCRMFNVLPSYHCYALTWINHFSVFQGCSVVVMAAFSLPVFLGHLAKYKVHLAHLVPPIMVQMAKCPIEEIRKQDLSKLKWIVSGAAPMGKETGDDIAKRLPGVRVKQGYGMTELAPVSIVERYGPPEDDGTGSTGVLLPNQVARLVDPETGKDVAMGQEGELWIAGPNRMKGYLNRPDATAETLAGDFLKTGDLAVVDERGRIFIQDRLKELIKVKGFQCAPAELEALLLTNELVADCAVIGIPDLVGSAGELVKAYVVLKSPTPDPAKTVKEIQDFVAKKVAHYKRLTGGVEFVESVPKSASGKILRRILRDHEKAKTAVKAKL